MGSHPQDTVLHKLLQCKSFIWVQFFINCSSMGSLPQGAVPQEQASPVWVPHRATSPASTPAPARASPRTTASFGLPPAPAWSPPWAAGVCLLHCGPPWTAGEQVASLWSFIISCKGRHSAPAPGATPPFSSSLTLVSVGLFHTFSLLSPTAKCCYTGGFFPLLKYVITEAPPLSLMGSALASGGPILELPGIGSVRHWGSF